MFKTSFINKLTNQEFPELVNNILSIKNVEEVDVDFVKTKLEEALSHDDELKFVMKMRNPHPLTEVLENDKNIRKKYLVGLNGRIRSSFHTPIEEEKSAAKVLLRWMNKHREHLHKPSVILQNRMVDNMTTDMELNGEIGEALTTLGLLPVFESIKDLTQSIRDNFSQRTEEQAANVLKAKEIRRKVYGSLAELLKAVDVALSMEEPEESFFLDYSREIIRYLDMYRTIYYARITRKRNAPGEEERSYTADYEDPIEMRVIPEKTMDSSQSFGYDEDSTSVINGSGSEENDQMM